MKYDAIVSHLGEFGPYQRRLYVLLCLPMASMGCQIMLTVFTLGVPDYRCALPDWVNDTYTVQGDQHANAINASIPTSEKTQLYAQCDVYNRTKLDFLATNDHNSTASVVYDMDNASFKSPNTTRKCQRWVYDREVYGSTIVTEYNWVCDLNLWKSHAQMMIMLGSLVGCVVSGPPADVIGRKKVFLVGAALHSAASILTAFATSFPLFGFLYFLNGLSTPAIWSNGFVIVVELVGTSRRTWAAIGVDFFWVFGCIVAVTTAYLVRNWQHVQLIVSVPTLLFLSYYWIIPESARWLISKHRYTEAERILRHAAKVNKKTLPIELFGGEVLSEEREEPIWKILTSSSLVVRSLIIFFNWTVCSLGFYGLGLNVGSLGGNVYANGYIGLTAEAAGYIACILLLDRIGRKALHCTSIIMGGLCCTATIIPVLVKAENLSWLSTALALTGRGFVSASFAVVWLYASELFPTVIRNSSLSVANVCARFGGVISPYIANLALLIPGNVGRTVPLIIFGTSMLAAGLLALLLPETLNRHLPETIGDAKNIKRTKTNDNGNTENMKDQEKFISSIGDNENSNQNNSAV